MIRVANLSVWPEYFRWQFITSAEFDFSDWIQNKLYVWDCDNGGDDHYYYVVIENDQVTFYKVEHSYYWDSASDDEIAENYVRNIFEITKCSKKDIGSWSRDNLKFIV